MKVEAGVDFWMYTGDRFLMYAEEYLKLNEQPEVIEEAEEVRINDAAVELAKIVKSTHFSPELSQQLSSNAQSASESMISVTKALRTIQSGYDPKTIKALKSFSESLSSIPSISDYYQNYQISQNISESNEKDKDITTKTK